MNKLLLVLLTVALLSIGIVVQANVLTTTITGIGSGTLGTVDFIDAGYTITAVADTSTWTNWGAGVYSVFNTTTSIVIDGVGSLTFATPASILCYQGWGAAGIGDNLDAPFITTLGSSEIGTWDMTTSIGPINGTVLWTGGLFTSDGLTLNTIDSDSGTFSSALSTPAVPEPATLLGFGIPVLMVGLGKLKSLRK